MGEIIKHKDLILRIMETEEQIMVSWEGRSTERDPSLFLMPIFNDLLGKQKKVVLNFKNLEFMNSSTITPLLKVMDRLKTSTGQIQIIYNKNLKWQDLSFTALEIFRTSDRRIDIVGE